MQDKRPTLFFLAGGGRGRDLAALAVFRELLHVPLITDLLTFQIHVAVILQSKTCSNLNTCIPVELESSAIKSVYQNTPMVVHYLILKILCYTDLIALIFNLTLFTRKVQLEYKLHMLRVNYTCNEP